MMPADGPSVRAERICPESGPTTGIEDPQFPRLRAGVSEVVPRPAREVPVWRVHGERAQRIAMALSVKPPTSPMIGRPHRGAYLGCVPIRIMARIAAELVADVARRTSVDYALVYPAPSRSYHLSGHAGPKSGRCDQDQDQILAYTPRSSRSSQLEFC